MAVPDGRFVVKPVENPAFRSNQLFLAFEDFRSPVLARLRARYGLDAVVAGEQDEWQRLLLLTNWIRSKIRVRNEPNPVRLDPFSILDAAMAGQGLFCTHFAIVQQAVFSSYGYVTRRLYCGSGFKEGGEYHVLNEVWINKLNKWVAVDGKYNVHFEKHGRPLSGLEIRDEVWKDGAKSVVRRFGPAGEKDGDQPTNREAEIEASPEYYRWCNWELTAHPITHPGPGSSIIVVYDDAIFRENTWHRGGKPFWAYNTPYLLKTTMRDWIEWTPNVIRSHVVVRDDRLVVTLSSFTPNLRSYQMRRGEGAWEDCDEVVEIPLQRALNQFFFRSVNVLGATGPEHRVDVAWEIGSAG